MLKKIVAISTLAMFLVSPACRRPGRKSEMIRLLDALRLQDIRRSPFQDPQTAGLTDIFFPYHSFPLPDEGAGENPFNLKKKMRRAGIDFNILFAPPSSEYVVNLGAGRGLRLDFGIGIIQDANAEKVRGSGRGLRERVFFEVILESAGREKAIFSKSLAVPPSAPESRLTLTEHSIVLPNLADPSRVIFRTKGAAKAFAFWVNPVFYRRQARPANVILVSLDTLRPDHLGCYGYERPTSPAMDALVGESVLFRRAYASSPWTLPSHVSMLTGLTTARHRVTRPDSRMNPAIVTLTDTLRRAGFYCAAFTGGGFLSSRYGFSKGFDFYSQVEGRFDFIDSAERMAASSSRWLEDRGDRNFFLFLHTYQIHAPFATPRPFNRMFLSEDAEWDELSDEFFKGNLAYRPLSEAQRQNVIGLYDAEIRYTDDKLIKPLIETLRRLGLWGRTLFILTADHGEEFFEHQAWLHSRQLYEESIRIPLLIKFPAGRFKGRKVEGPVRLIDIMPTVLDVLGVGQAPAGMDGTSLLPAVKKGRSEDRLVLAELGLDPKYSVRKCLIRGWDKIIRNDFTAAEDPSDNTYRQPPRPPLELYLLAEDPKERKNAIDREPELARNMAAILKAILAAFPQGPEHKVEFDQALREQLRALGYIR